MSETTTKGPPEAAADRPKTRWFSATGGVVEYADRREVFVGGALIASFAHGDRVQRDLAIVALTRDGRVAQRKLATALGISQETVRKVVVRFEREGVAGIVKVRKGGRRPGLAAKQVAQLHAAFDQGLTIDEAHRQLRRRVSRATVGRVHGQWAEAKAKAEAERQQREREASAQLSLETAVVTVKKERRAERARPATEATEAGPEAAVSEELGLAAAVVIGGPRVQHLGCWIMLAMLHALGWYRYAEYLRAQKARELAAKGKRFVGAVALRVVLDAVAVALSLGQRTVEGVRRVATPSAATLLRHRGAVSSTWAREVLGRFAAHQGPLLHLSLATALIRQGELGAAKPGRAVFYLDNHLRPYTGQQVIRKGWRMQAKRVMPGHADYWVHDGQGRPVLRVNSPEHASLVQWLRPIGSRVRELLAQPECRVLLVFDRAGAFAGELAALRDADFEFVTYERKRYRKLARSAFSEQLQLGKERIEFTEATAKNLKRGRGRVRRIVLRMADGEQVNVLAVSDAPAPELIKLMLARWACQENQFKYGVERWGINQLDGRRVIPYPPEAVIPSPARRRAKRALQVAQHQEGEALRRLAAVPTEHRERERWENQLAGARAKQVKLRARLRRLPKHVAVKDTELADTLVTHADDYKLVLDALRIALTNAESWLAARLAPHLPRAVEAKKTLANLLSAPGTVQVHQRTVTVTLSPAGTAAEYRAFHQFLAGLNALGLTLPGETTPRRLRFQVQEQ